MRLLIILLLAALVSCSSQKKAKGTIVYPGPSKRTATLHQGYAIPPRRAPAAVKRAIAAGNRLQTLPYKWGGGHAVLNDTGYDCSGAVSYVLREAGLLDGQMPSSGFFEYGKKGYGNWINVYVRKGHVFMTVAGLRLDTGGGRSNESGPRWKPHPRKADGHIVRHPRGL